MNKYFLLTGFAGLVILLAGCNPTMSQTRFSKEELSWQKSIRDNYPGYCPPRTSAPALQDRAGNTYGVRAAAPAPKPNIVEQTQPANEEMVVEEFKPTQKQETTAKTVDEAADKTAKKEVKKDAPKADAKKEVKKDAPKADAKKDAKKDAPKADAKKEVKKDTSIKATEYTVTKGDTLGKIAQKFYGDAQKYELIVKANPQLNDPKKLKVGTKIQIPRY